MVRGLESLLLNLDQRLDDQAAYIEELHNQLSVFTRLLIKHFNFHVEMYNADLEAREFEDKIPPIILEMVQKTFVDLAEFKKRPDRDQWAHIWFMGEDLKNLPPLPEPSESTSVSSPPTHVVEGMDGAPEGAQIFGGDYGDSRDENVSTEAEHFAAAGQKDELYPLRDEDPAGGQPADAEDGPGLSEVRNTSDHNPVVGVGDDRSE